MVAIDWRVHLASPPDRVFDALATDSGRASFWAESAARRGDQIEWRFPGGHGYRGPILAEDRPRTFTVSYYGDTRTTFTLSPDGQGGTDVRLADDGVAEADHMDVLPGWVSVLMALKAYVDHGVDLRNHDNLRSWDRRYCDN
jgi:uncharacterized protein YndB with AHSA1/START domain